MEVETDMDKDVNDGSRKKTLRTFYIASHSDAEGNNSSPKKCCISLPPYVWEVFDQNLAAASGSRKMSASYYLRRLLRKFLLSEGVPQREIHNEWDSFRSYCDSRGKTYVSMMQKIICDAHNGVNTIMDMDIERLHYDLFERTYSDEFNDRLMRALERLSEVERRNFEADYSTTSVQIPCNANANTMKKLREGIASGK